MLRIVREVRPRWVLAENVPGLRTLGADRVLEDLEAEGYACWPLVVGACDVGATHRRKRVWIVANRESSRREVGPGPKGREENEWTVATIPDRSCSALAHGDSAGRGTERSGGLLDGERQAPRHDADGRGVRPVDEPTGPRLDVPHAEGSGRAQQGDGRLAGSRLGCDGTRWPARPGEPQHEWEEPRLVANAEYRREGLRSGALGPEAIREGSGGNQSATVAARGSAQIRITGHSQQPVGGAAHGLPERLVRRANREALRALGNAVVPQVVVEIGKAIIEAELRFAQHEM